MNANPYLLIGARLGVPGTDPLLHRLADWHDAMVAHERARRYESCGEECPHALARELWKEAVKKFGRGANELAFLRTRASQLGKAA
jgi:hypothetical protein